MPIISQRINKPAAVAAGSVNTIDAFNDANAWAYYPMREQTAPYADPLLAGPDLQSTGTAAPANGSAFGIPGLTKGTPRHGACFAIASNSITGTVVGSGGPDADTWTEGGMGVAFRILEWVAAGDELYLMSVEYTDTSLDRIRLRIDNLGRIECFVTFGSESITIRSASNTIGSADVGVDHSVLVMQPDTISDPIIYLDGVDVTDSVVYGAGQSAGDWVAALAAADGSTVTAANLFVGTDSQLRTKPCIYSVPAIYLTGLTPAQALEFHNAFNFDGDPTDFGEYWMDKAKTADWSWIGGFNGQTNSQPVLRHLTYSNNERQASYVGTLFYDNAPQIVSDYNIQEADFSLAVGSPPNINRTMTLDNVGPSSTTLTGSFVAIFEPKDASSAANEQHILSLGSSVGPLSWDTDANGGFHLYMIGNDTGLSLFLILHDPTNGSELRIGSAFEYSPDEAIVLVISQDGTGLSAWVNGVSKSITSVATKSGGSDITTEWIGDAMSRTPWYYRMGYSFVSGVLQDFEGSIVCDMFTADGDVYGQTEVDELMNFVNGTI